GARRGAGAEPDGRPRRRGGARVARGNRRRSVGSAVWSGLAFGAAHLVKEVGHGRDQGTSGVRGTSIHAGFAGQEDRCAARVRLRADGGLTPLKQESLRGREASGSKRGGASGGDVHRHAPGRGATAHAGRGGLGARARKIRWRRAEGSSPQRGMAGTSTSIINP